MRNKAIRKISEHKFQTGVGEEQLGGEEAHAKLTE